MKRLVIMSAMLAIAATATSATAQRTTRVDGYTRSDGTYVQPHQRTAPNSTRNDNWSTRGNTNPNTGQPGTKPRDNEYRPYRPR